MDSRQQPRQFSVCMESGMAPSSDFMCYIHMAVWRWCMLSLQLLKGIEHTTIWQIVGLYVFSGLTHVTHWRGGEERSLLSFFLSLVLDQFQSSEEKIFILTPDSQWFIHRRFSFSPSVSSHYSSIPEKLVQHVWYFPWFRTLTFLSSQTNQSPATMWQ